MTETVYDCDIAIIGAGMGGVAASLAACAAGMRVVLTDPTDWIGGQMTAQGVSAFDEHPLIETQGATRRYYQLRNAIRAAVGADNPGNGWVSRLCFEPRVGLACLEAMIAPYQEHGLLRLLLEVAPVAAEMSGAKVASITLKSTRDPGAPPIRVRAAYVLDATELGDLLPLTGTAYVKGAEAFAETGEDGAPDVARPGEVQSFTYCFAVEHRPGERHIIPAPAGYAQFRDTQPYSLTLTGHDGSSPRPFQMFGGDLPFWTYRRIRDGAMLGGNDLALINWHSNDYFGRTLIDVPDADQQAAHDEAKRLSLGFLHWLQTECPRDAADGGGFGYPELMLRPDVMGTPDGLGKHPYIRESRRIRALRQIRAHEIAAATNVDRAQTDFPDSVGVGWYAMDLHPCVGNPHAGRYQATILFQIPLGALIPERTQNLIAACKNIGTTHLTNGAYRLHPIEWNTGEAAGALAAFCITENCTPHAVDADHERLRRFQDVLRGQGVPLHMTL
jgi:hypothetical protein